MDQTRRKSSTTVSGIAVRARNRAYIKHRPFVIYPQADKLLSDTD